MSNSSFIGGLVASAVKRQGKLFRYKDSITLALVGIVWVAAFVVTYLTGIPEQAAVVIGIVGNLAANIVTRLSPGAITPSMAQRLEKQAEQEQAPPRHSAPGNWIDDARHRMGQVT